MFLLTFLRTWIYHTVHFISIITTPFYEVRAHLSNCENSFDLNEEYLHDEECKKLLQSRFLLHVSQEMNFHPIFMREFSIVNEIGEKNLLKKLILIHTNTNIYYENESTYIIIFTGIVGNETVDCYRSGMANLFEAWVKFC